MSFFRYPGGKTKLKNQIIDRLLKVKNNENLEFSEPFFGGGVISIDLLKKSKISKVRINDKDVGITCLWNSVIKHPKELQFKIRRFKPSVKKFYQFKQELLQPYKNNNELDVGFKKLAIHQMSFSGLGTKSGSPLGGKLQNSKYKIDCRWSAENICKKINNIHQLFNSCKISKNKCTNWDFEKVINDSNENTLMYLDPVYYEQGNNLYQIGFSEKEHMQLCELLKNANFKWLLSYDNHPKILEMYDWANIEVVPIKYSIAGQTLKSELLISQK